MTNFDSTMNEAMRTLHSAVDISDTPIAVVAERASAAFFAVVACYFPTASGDFPPDAHVAWEEASQSAVRTIASNR